ncbi:uncharacterized protein TNCV_4568261 [Trichonephila clavipes]|nr:uncharacterized protein TNCV_4568261 [Trichonephila clavipes]
MPPDRQCQIEAYEIHRGKGIGVHLSLALALSTIQERGHGSLVKVSDRDWQVTSSSPVSLKTRFVGKRCTLNLSRTQMSSRWCGVVARRGGYQLRCRPRHLTMIQNDEVHHQKPSCYLTVRS